MRRQAAALTAIALLCSCGWDPAMDRGVPPEAGVAAPGAVEEALRITAIDVGQGDAALIETPSGGAILIDAGPPGAGASRIVPLLESKGIGELDLVFITHHHEDHAGGLAEVLAGADGIAGTDDDIAVSGGIYDDGDCGGDGSGTGSDDAGVADPGLAASPGDAFRVGDVSLEVVAACGRVAGEAAPSTAGVGGGAPDENAMSLVILIERGGFRMLMTGDITGGGGEPPYQTMDVETPLGAAVGDIDVLKVAHHGSNTSSNQAFLDATGPEVAIISVGDGNDFGHPHRLAVERLLESGAVVYQTERGWLDLEGPVVADGDVTIEVDEDGEYRIILE
jgi:competence protein ComEC